MKKIIYFFIFLFCINIVYSLPLNISCFGDSITARSDRYCDMLNATDEIITTNYGKSGDGVDGLYNRDLNESPRDKPFNWTIILIGTNDLQSDGGSGWRVDYYTGKLKLVVDQMINSDVVNQSVLLSTIPPCNRPDNRGCNGTNQTIVELYNDAIRYVSWITQVPYVDIFDTVFGGSFNSSQFEFGDGLHPNEIGAKGMNETYYNALFSDTEPYDCNASLENADMCYNFTYVYTDYNKTGLVSTTPGDKPFWTNESNPVQFNMTENQSVIFTWTVNATGYIDSINEFFVYVNNTENESINNVTNFFYITITNETTPSEPNLVITSKSTSSLTNESVTISWNTNITSTANLSVFSDSGFSSLIYQNNYSVFSTSFSQSVTGLIPETTYYVNITVQNGTKSDYDDTLTFTTSATTLATATSETCTNLKDNFESNFYSIVSMISLLILGIIAGLIYGRVSGNENFQVEGKPLYILIGAIAVIFVIIIAISIVVLKIIAGAC